MIVPPLRLNMVPGGDHCWVRFSTIVADVDEALERTGKVSWSVSLGMIF